MQTRRRARVRSITAGGSIAALLASAVIVATGTAASASTISVSTEAEYRQALSDLSDDSSGPHVIEITSDFSIDGTSFFSYKGDQDLTIEGNGHLITQGPGGSYFMFFEGTAGVLTVRDLNFSEFNRLTAIAHNFATDDDIVVENCTFTGMHGDNDGVAISSAGADVYIYDSTFTDNTSPDIYYGGPVYVYSADVHVERSTFSGGEGRFGGAIHVDEGDVTVIDGVFNDNASTARDGGYLGQGGAIWASGTVTVSGDSSFTGNYAEDEGGAIYAEGGVDVTDTDFIDNTAEGSGGAIATFDEYPTIVLTTVRGGTFSGNQSGLDGGAINTVDLDLAGATFTDNSADRWGGAINAWNVASIGTTTFTGNSSGSDGGAANLDGDNITITDSVFTTNTAGTDSSLGYEEDDGYGGAVWAYDGLTITGSTFTGNETLLAYGGALFVEEDAEIATSTFTDNTAYGDGGAVEVDGDVVIETSSFTGNYSGDDGGAVYGYHGLVEITDSTFATNEAGDDGGAVYSSDNSVSATNSTFYGNVSGDEGGAIQASESVTLIVSTLVHNTAEYGAHVYVENHGDHYLDSIGTVFADAVGTDGCYFEDADNTVAYTFDADGTCSQTSDGVGGNIVGHADPKLGALGENGGPTQTMEPLSGSPLVDAFVFEECVLNVGLDADQRGVDRPQGSDCEIGAVEVIPDLIYEYYDGPTLIATATVTNAVDYSCGDTYTVAELGGTPPADVTFPWGAFDWCIQVPGAGWSTTVTWTFPSPVNQMWKIDDAENWTLVTTATFSGTTVTYTVTDGGPLDLDGAEDNYIYDPAAPGIGATFTG